MTDDDLTLWVCMKIALGVPCIAVLTVWVGLLLLVELPGLLGVIAAVLISVIGSIATTHLVVGTKSQISDNRKDI